MRVEYGGYKLVHAKRAVPRDPRETRSQALDTFAATLREGQVHAIAAVREDRHMEGGVWFCLLRSDAYVAPER